MCNDLTGMRFGRLLVLGLDETSVNTQWLCQCSCNAHTIKSVRTTYLISGNTQSCGCLNKDHIRKISDANYLGDGVAAFNAMYRNYKYAAKRNNRCFTLTKQQFRRLTQSNCVYCGQTPTHTYRQGYNKTLRTPYVGNGIDRVDNSIGYTLDNCVACCKTCNYAKHNMTTAEFLAWLDQLVAHRCKNV